MQAFFGNTLYVKSRVENFLKIVNSKNRDSAFVIRNC